MVGVFSFAALVEADSGFPDRNNTQWAEYTRHEVTERHIPERSRTLRAIIHADDKHATRVTPGTGRFIVCEQEDVLAISLHLPFVNNEDEQEIIRNHTLAEVSATIRKRRKGRQVLVQGDFNVDWLPSHQCDPLPLPDRQAHHANERMQLLAWAESCGLALVLPGAFGSSPCL